MNSNLNLKYGGLRLRHCGTSVFGSPWNKRANSWIPAINQTSLGVSLPRVFSSVSSGTKKGCCMGHAGQGHLGRRLSCPPPEMSRIPSPVESALGLVDGLTRSSTLGNEEGKKKKKKKIRTSIPCRTKECPAPPQDHLPPLTHSSDCTKLPSNFF